MNDIVMLSIGTAFLCAAMWIFEEFFNDDV